MSGSNLNSNSTSKVPRDGLPRFRAGARIGRAFFATLILCGCILTFDRAHAQATRSEGTSPANRTPVGRRTVDRNQDLFLALIRANRITDAIDLCEMQWNRADPQSDQAAQWTVAKSIALSSQQLTRDKFTELDIEAASRPIAVLLAAYPSHPRRLFLVAQSARVRRDAAQHSVLRAAISPSDDALREAAASRLVRAARTMEQLVEQIADEQARIGSSRSAATAIILSDLERLEQELQVDAVSLSLAQTELFVRGSKDCIAAAVNAEKAATTAVENLTDGSMARTEVNRLRIDAILRAGQVARANAEWERAFAQSMAAKSPRFLALRVRIDLALGQLAKADSILSAFFGSSPETAQRSVEMDLARLEYLFQSKQGQGVGGWLDTISRRGGAFARRRAEAWSLNYLKRGSSGTGPKSDPSVVAAQAKDWLRRGELSRAAELLSAAAASETNPDRAITRSIEAAAVWRKAGSVEKASEVMSDIALSQPAGRGAAEAHLQSIVMVASGSQPDATAIEGMLRRNLQQWPAGKSADGSRRWLIQILVAQSRPIEAAKVASQIDMSELNPTNLDRMRDQWMIAFRSVGDDQVASLDEDLRSALQPSIENLEVQSLLRELVVLVGQRTSLDDLPKSSSTEPSWVGEVQKIRQSGSSSGDVAAVPEEYHSDIIRRLMLDGREYPERRGMIASTVSKLPTAALPSPDHVERLLWTDQTTAAIAMAAKLVDEAADSTEAIRELSRLLGDSPQVAAQQQAITWWDQIAAGTTAGSDLWHEAKLAAIGLLAKTGKPDQAKKRAKYILLTHPGISPDLRSKYQSFDR